ncbi:MAG TPA: AMP-binding protein [Kofleriaceae bacterium]|nr:AMP-binding protein [Kofleriaceae bacterium]
MQRAIPPEWRARAPAMTEGAWAGLSRVLEHVDAPRYNRTLGDRVGDGELAALAAMRAALATAPREADRAPSARTADFVEALRDRLWLLDDLPDGLDVARDFEELPTTDRDALAHRLHDLVPRDLPLDDAIVYSTSATTGHAVIVPSHPRAMVQNLAHLERLAAFHGVTLAPREGEPAAMNASMQRQTYVFATTMSGWAGGVFVKVNLAPHDWAGGEASRARFLADVAPPFLASEPVTLGEAIRLELPLRPRFVVSSAIGLPPAVAARVRDAWGAAVVDLYSTTETGPIAATVPGVDGHVVLLPDLYVEALDAHGARVADGLRGELTVTGGRNPFLPLVRYRTGDHGRLATVTLPDGSRARVILDLEGRAPVTFRATDGGPVGSVDLARRLRAVAPFVQHALHQRADGSVELRLRPLPGVPIPRDDFAHVLRDLLGRDAAVTVVVDPALGSDGKKVVAWRSDL